MPDPISTFFLICFLLGAILAFVSLLTGTAHLPIPSGHGLHVGHQIGIASSNASGHHATPVLNFGSLLAFLAWFGGIGFLLRTLSPLGLILVLLLSLVAGLAGASLIVVLLVKVLLPAETTIDPGAYRLDGTPGRITAGIPAGGTGEITYSKAGTRRSDAARTIDGSPMPRGEEVIILAYRHGIAYVQSLNRYLASSARSIAGQLAALDHDGDPSTPIDSQGIAENIEPK